MKKLPWYCRCDKSENQTLSMFPANRPILMQGGCGSAQTHSSPPPDSYEMLMESRLRNINGPTFARLGEWDGS